MQIAVQGGLDGPSVRLVLDGDGFADAVRNYIDEARRRRIGGVPYFLFDDGFSVSGAGSGAVFATALAKVRST